MIIITFRAHEICKKKNVSCCFETTVLSNTKEWRENLDYLLGKMFFLSVSKAFDDWGKDDKELKK